jgi:hypothetical protein
MKEQMKATSSASIKNMINIMNDFIKSNDLYSSNKDLTNSFQNNIKHFLNTNTSLIRK